METKTLLFSLPTLEVWSLLKLFAVTGEGNGSILISVNMSMKRSQTCMVSFELIITIKIYFKRKNIEF